MHCPIFELLFAKQDHVTPLRNLNSPLSVLFAKQRGMKEREKENRSISKFRSQSIWA